MIRLVDEIQSCPLSSLRSPLDPKSTFRCFTGRLGPGWANLGADEVSVATSPMATVNGSDHMHLQ